ncbi:hypothetical protein U9M48_035856 [Paspalum notatum var. saurae]|uniref:Uncharacterized protein n=1 Tax=Paspalum notatum var. saurae TaxID=547442 RepID=A0AAQ3UDG8_PASNO
MATLRLPATPGTVTQPPQRRRSWRPSHRCNTSPSSLDPQTASLPSHIPIGGGPPPLINWCSGRRPTPPLRRRIPSRHYPASPPSAVRQTATPPLHLPVFGGCGGPSSAAALPLPFPRR